MKMLKLAFCNVRRSFRDFSVYFLTLTLGVCLFYIFNSIEGQQAIMDLTSGQAVTLKTLNTIMANFSIFIAAILGFLIIYANRYLIKRRKQEFGTYMLLGMERGRISVILVLETISVGLIALVAGNCLGILLSQAMAVVTAKLLGAGIASFSFIFSFEALKESILYFSLTFLLVMIFNIIVVRRQKLIDLIYATRRNEYFKTPHLALSVLLFVAALAGLTTAYIIILNDGLANPLLMWAAIGVGVLGTFLFFFSLSGFLLKLFQQIKKIYLRGLNMFVLRQINNKINTAYVSIMMVCLMLFVSICTLSSGMGLANAFAADVLKNTPFDATFSVGRIYDDENYGRYPERGFDILTAADQHKVEINSFAKAYQTVRYYAATDNFWSLDDPSGAALESELYFIKLSDYNRVLELQGIAPIKLGSDQYAVDSTTANSAWIDFVKPQIVGRSVAVGGAELRLDATQIFSHALETNVNPNFDLVIVAPDNLLANAPAKRDLLHVQYHQSSQRDERLAIDNFSKIGGTELANSLETKIAVVEHNSSNTTTVAYLAVYLGVVFLIASATVLAITQLSEASDNVRRYQLLDKIGAERRLINRAIFWQAVVYFGAPLVLALAHSLIGISAVAKLVESFRGSDILASSLITAIVIIIVYGGYFWATYLGSKNLIRREYSARRE